MSLSQRFFTDAFRDMQRAMAVFDEPFFNAARRSLLTGPTSSFLHHRGNILRYPATDVLETSDAYELHAELPGYDKKNIKIELADNQTLVLSGKMEEQYEAGPSTTAEKTTAVESSAEAQTTPSADAGQQAQQEVTKTSDADKQVAQPAKNGTQYWVKERSSGSFSRSFAFPQPIKSEGIKASFENGVLKVTVPKTVENQAKQINID
ncbi:HSP20-like chaperone [Mycotypha africana]|uniref:HSP20-like chaperone n=1 Tax=Mycotypha africana TaxID=64632 RepID=UPI0023011440|nr:HSP20-like chaperone [Mycotypha africana]KAI8973679.1 HSP20-like chaperone [Mycotypha africana]